MFFIYIFFFQIWTYAQTLILVNLIVVKIIGFLVITRNPPDQFWRNLVEILPTGLPDLPKSSGTSKKARKTKFLRREKFEQFYFFHDY